MDDDQRRKRDPVDRVEQEHPARLQDAVNFIEHPVQIGDVLQDVHTDDAVDAMVDKGDAFTATDLVIDFLQYPELFPHPAIYLAIFSSHV